MSWIETVSPEHAEGALAELYGAIAKARGAVADVHLAQSLHPRALRAHLELYKAVVLGPASLPRVDRERIAVVVSFANGCTYCVRHHAEALRQIGDTRDIVAALEQGVVPSTLPERDRRLLEWAAQGTLAPSHATEGDVVRLRELGLDDRALLDATLTVAYFNFVNRIVLAIGVDLEQRFEETCGPDRSDAGEEP